MSAEVIQARQGILEQGGSNMKINRRFTEAGKDIFEQVEWTKRSSRISNPDGSTVFEMNDAEVPASWSQLATDIMVSKYFRKAGVPQPDGSMGPEKSAKQVVHRLAGCWRHWGEQHGYFDTADDAQTFYDELCYMMLNQMCAPNSPQWFNTGLNWAYDINGPAQGHYYTDPETGETRQSEDAYGHPQPHACFIQNISDDLVNPGGIMDLWVREARLFKYGSGTGSNFSQLRAEGESLSGGGRSSGLMSFLKIGDRAAGAIKSGGTTRRAAKMVCLDLDHPDIDSFVNWKVREEIKVAALVEGMKHLKHERTSEADPETIGETAERLGLKLDYDFNGESYQTVSGQNSNNSVRIPNSFFEAVENDDDWQLIRRTDGEVARTIPARKLWDDIGYAAWRCADPGVQYDTTINQWHTCPQSGRINASNPCSEYMFLDNTACNLASLNLMKFYDAKTREFDVEAFEHGIRLWTIVLEISVLMASFPSKEIAELSYRYRTLGLGYANIGAMLMQAGIPYDSDKARAICGCITAILTGRAYATSAEMAGELGAFEGYEENRGDMLRVMRNHHRAAWGVTPESSDKLGDYEALDIPPVAIEGEALTNEDTFGELANSSDLLSRARKSWDEALEMGEAHGYRNAQSTVIAPTGTIGLLMDCDTTGVEPDFALVKFKKLAGGGYFKIANQSVRPALESLGYSKAEVADILHYVVGTLTLDVPMPNEEGEVSADQPETATFTEYLKNFGFKQVELDRLAEALPGAMEIGFIFNNWTLGEDCIDRLKLRDETDLLKGIGLSKKQVAKLNEMICGTGTIEGAPHMKEAHYAVFDCANKCGKIGQRFIAVEGHIRMMAAAQPFISGAISKTINLPNEANVEDIKSAYRLSWELGLKANALYRDGCKLSQPLNSAADEDVEDEEGIEAAREEIAGEVAGAAAAAAAEPVEKIVERIVERPLRRRLPDTRTSKTHKFCVAGHEGYITVGLYEDGTPGELFITMAKEGSTIGGLMDSLGTAISITLQYGVPVESLVNKFTHQRFEPAGMTHNRDIPFAKSLVDYIFRWMGMEFIPGYRAANAPRRPGDEKPASEKTAARDKAKAVASGNGNGKSNGHSNGNGNGHGAAPAVEGVKISDSSSRPDRNLNPQAASRRSHTQTSFTAGQETAGEMGGGATPETETDNETKVQSSLMMSMREMQADAPACDVCGTITVRSGTCYKCLNCGHSMGCS